MRFDMLILLSSYYYNQKIVVMNCVLNFRVTSLRFGYLGWTSSEVGRFGRYYGRSSQQDGFLCLEPGSR